MFVIKKRVLIAFTTVALLITAGPAVADLVGSGTDTTAMRNSSAVRLAGARTATLYPGTSSPVTFTVDNPSRGIQRVGTIHLASVATDAAHRGCVVTDFKMPDVVANQSFSHGNDQAVTARGTLTMANTSVSQDACEGAPLTLNLTSN